jgi:steroid delta-isomerase-like uncharacterized protein
MSSEENAATMQRWFTEGWKGDVEMADEIFSPTLTTNGIVVGIAGPKRNITNQLTGFPDVTTVIEEVIAAGDKVVLRVLWQGTHTGPYSGVPATGKPVEVRVLSSWRFDQYGKVEEIWTIQDQFSLLQQVGYLPADLYSAQVPAARLLTNNPS